MRVFVLGGSGKVGRPVVRLLAADEGVAQVAVAGRDLERATGVAGSLGEKVVAVQADGTAEDMLVSQLNGYDVLLNTAFADSALPAIRAAIRTGIPYCDVVSFGPDIDTAAAELSSRAEAADICAVLANGIHPSITNLMGVHVARQLDEVEQLQLGDASMFDFETGRDLTPRQWLEDPQQSQVALRDSIDSTAFSLQTGLEAGAKTVLNYRDGSWQEVDPVESGADVPLLDGGSASIRPYLCSAPLFDALPTDLGARPPAEMLFSPLPPQLHDVLRELAVRVLERDIDLEAAIESFFATIADNPGRWLTLPDDYTPIAKTWTRAIGTKDGRPVRSTCWLTAPAWDLGGYLLTSVALVAATKLIVRDDVLARGVIAAEKAFNPLRFLDECAQLLGDSLPNGELTRESFEYLS